MQKKHPWAGKLIHLSTIILSALLLMAMSVTSASGGETGQVPSANNISGYKTKHVFIVVMDGVRYSETFGDSTHALVPHLYNDLKPEGTLFTNFYNRGITVTRQGHSTLISDVRGLQEVND
jgi:predicted AlkP superfamily pyrophosphatase or phosphodiesterase